MDQRSRCRKRHDRTGSTAVAPLTSHKAALNTASPYWLPGRCYSPYGANVR